MVRISHPILAQLSRGVPLKEWDEVALKQAHSALARTVTSLWSELERRRVARWLSKQATLEEAMRRAGEAVGVVPLEASRVDAVAREDQALKGVANEDGDIPF